ncbi:MAG: hypothetical protein FWF56_02580 [Firmicutes bacterium]|nr:hypothetical protein [Bacillota bacterium]MCL1953517.1 hypothetical protein [Bacillota bacterium]
MNENNTKIKYGNVALWIILLVVLFGSAIGAFSIGRVSANNERTIQNNKGKTHYIYMCFGTLPILYQSINLLSHNNPSYVYFGRVDTFNLSKLPSNVTLLDDKSHVEIGEQGVLDMADKVVKNINDKDNTARYKFFVDDIRVLMPFHAFLTNGIDSSRFQIIMVSDGTASYNTTPNTLMGQYIGENGIDEWNKDKIQLDEILDNFKNGDGKIVEPDEIMGDLNTAYVASQIQGVEYWMQYPEFAFLHKDISQEIRSEIMRSNIVKKQPYNMLSSLSSQSKELFFEATLNNPNHAGGAVKSQLDELLNQDKPVLLISGTHIGEGKNPDKFDDAVQVVIDNFADDYTIMLKPHPAQDINSPQFDITKERGIAILPPQLPMEVIMWSYPSINVGGYNSSLYMAAQPSQVKFFFGKSFPNGGLITELLSILYDNNFFGDAVMLEDS